MLEAAAVGFLVGGLIVGADLYYYFSIKEERLKTKQMSELFETTLRFRTQRREMQDNHDQMVRELSQLREENVSLQGRLQQVEIELAQYKIMSESLENIEQHAREARLSDDEIKSIVKQSANELVTSFLEDNLESISTFLLDIVTGEFLREPVVLPSGYTLNKSTVEEIYRSQQQPCCPVTGIDLPADISMLQSNRAIKELLSFLISTELQESVEHLIATYSSEHRNSIRSCGHSLAELAVHHSTILNANESGAASSQSASNATNSQATSYKR